MDPFMAVTCPEELQKKLMQMQNKTKQGIDLAASVVVAPSGIKKKNKVAAFRDLFMGSN